MSITCQQPGKNSCIYLENFLFKLIGNFFCFFSVFCLTLDFSAMQNGEKTMIDITLKRVKLLKMNASRDSQAAWRKKSQEKVPEET